MAAPAPAEGSTPADGTGEPAEAAVLSHPSHPTRLIKGRANALSRTLRLQMDNCAGTNKSQFIIAGLAMLVALNIVEVVLLQFMVAGHTKFAPDENAQKISG